MDTVAQALQRHKRIGLDTSIFIYHFEGNPRYGAVASAAMAELTRGAFESTTSTVTLMELIVRPLRMGNANIASQYEPLLQGFANLSVVDIDLAVARRAGALRANYYLRPADALQVAAALVHGATAFLTNDRRLQHINELDVLLLDNYVSAT